ncbi:MAG TPA: hypothetical protein VJT50_11650 [Pyrinomonadaceae bacterium]|nr:hypothetical protein [Pyrinomonadaceae bacterium]
MKFLKAICVSTVFALVLNVSALAGDIASPGAPSPGAIGSGTGEVVVSPQPATDATFAEIGTDGNFLTNTVLALISLF